MMDERSPDEVARLLQRAGARRAVSPERSARVKDDVHDAWTDAGRVRSRQRIVVVAAGVLAAAAGVAIAIRLRPIDTRPSPVSHALVARVAAAAGTVSANGAAIRAGDEIVD